MKYVLKLGLFAVLIATAVHCGPKVMVPPKIDLTQHEVVGIIEFGPPSEGELGPYITKKFTEAIRRDQGMVRIVELGTEAEVLKVIGRDKLDKAAFQALGERYDVRTIFAGEVESSVRPMDLSVTPGFGSVKVEAEMIVSLDAQMVETFTGASVWSGSESETKKVGEVSIFGSRDFDFDAENPDKVIDDLIEEVVEEVTRDFRNTWVRQ
ncbi:hypothetical protein AMJ52_05010 [candidate division TA06 bacterium DG_78]|uniref:Lipoprotein n=1 Tax=candidate division TA06 bacterium DG_78 TaxID=1703772 RepID=A0A0S7YDH4_UNCT6|nr:MAG: hypothetical protein AMJ52_05010 [candidate division TA06 bacterium DG_78]